MIFYASSLRRRRSNADSDGLDILDIDEYPDAGSRNALHIIGSRGVRPDSLLEPHAKRKYAGGLGGNNGRRV